MKPFILFSISILLFNLGTVYAKEEPFRPTPGQFPPLKEAHSYRGELVFVDHANRRGSIRLQGKGIFFRNDPHPFAMLPYGIVRYRGATADLRDIPLGTVLHVRAYLPPEPRISSVPVLPVDNKKKDANHNRGAGIFPAENHVLLIEDEPSHCLNSGKVWKLKNIELKGGQGTIVAIRESPKANSEENVSKETMTFDSATRIWRGRERLTIQELVSEGIWPSSGKKDLNNQAVQLGVCWKPTPGSIFTRFHISDIWLDDTAMQRAAQNQNETHKAFIRSRWLPARVDHVEYEKFGHAQVTVTLFGGMDGSLYTDFKKGVRVQANPVENTLKHTHGAYGPAHMSAKGPITEVIKTKGEVPLGNSGIQIKFKTDLIIEGIRPGRTIRISPNNWPKVNLPREEYLKNSQSSINDRFPSPDIFPKY